MLNVRNLVWLNDKLIQQHQNNYYFPGTDGVCTTTRILKIEELLRRSALMHTAFFECVKHWSISGGVGPKKSKIVKQEKICSLITTFELSIIYRHVDLRYEMHTIWKEQWVGILQLFHYNGVQKRSFHFEWRRTLKSVLQIIWCYPTDASWHCLFPSAKLAWFFSCWFENSKAQRLNSLAHFWEVFVFLYVVYTDVFCCFSIIYVYLSVTETLIILLVLQGSLLLNILNLFVF